MADKILFGIPEDNNPALTRKLAHGTGVDEARSMTFQGLITWLTSRLPFFNTANNLSEANATAVRGNLSFNSIAENTAALALKADKTNVIEKNSTVIYSPTLETHPTNKRYVDNAPVISSISKTTFTNAYVEDTSTVVWAWKAGFLIISFRIGYDSLPPEGAIIFTLPASVPTFFMDTEIALVGTGGNIHNLRAAGGTRNIVAGQYSSGSTIAYGSACIPLN